jgi:drug/metabolite transporter (DMT)-like permease
MEGRKKVLIIFGMILFIIGVVVSFYPTVAPYKSVGIVLALAGSVCVVLGLLYSRALQKIRPSRTNPQQPSST